MFARAAISRKTNTRIFFRLYPSCRGLYKAKQFRKRDPSSEITRANRHCLFLSKIIEARLSVFLDPVLLAKKAPILAGDSGTLLCDPEQLFRLPSASIG
jgi:hypothetical protein